MPAGGSGGYNASVGRFQDNIQVIGTLKNLFVYIISNARTTTTTIGILKNAVSGNLVVSIGGGISGIFEDISNTDSIAAGDLVNFYLTTGTGTETIDIRPISVEFLTTDSKFVLSGCHGGSTQTLSLNTTYWFYPGGNLAVEQVTESLQSTESQMSFNVTNLWCFISANSLTATSTFSVRKNQGTGNNSVSIGSGATGEFIDTTNTDSFTATDEINLQMITGATGTSMVMRVWSFLVTNTDSGGGISIPVAMHHLRQMMG